MTVTFEQMQVAVDSARRMRDALDCHLGMLDAKAKALSVEGRNIPSDNNFFLYTADAKGLIRIQQDAAFIVEAVLVVQPQISPVDRPFDSTAEFYELSLKDANAGRDLTGGFHPLYDSTVAPLPEEDTNFVPGWLFVPISGSSNDMGVASPPNVDDWKTTKAEYLLPRGSVVRALFKSSGLFEVGTAAVPLPDVILAGYKVF